MGIERALADRKGRDFCGLPKETNANSKSRKNRRRQMKMSPVQPQMKMSPVQRLFETCREVFASGGTGIIPPPKDIEKLRAVIDAIKLEDVGLRAEMRYFRKRATHRTPRITYVHIFECEKFSIGIFCLPPSGVIPLHNHPGMTVFSKLLFGTMHIKSYDWVADLHPDTPTVLIPPEIKSSEVRLAKVKVDADFTAPCNPSILYPADGGNMHCFTAVTACAVLDVLGPPYSDPDGRHCTYYLNYPFSHFSVDGIVVPEEERKGYEWLRERERLDDIVVDGAKYRGPKIAEE
ncbi:plant cysteine oxidase 2-like [Prosopis cineraria]|uniref:plant cysteine oxidase 2-like n=1 Tax=Prosopis cineraria TaxID=364024 RepID=UPI0024102E39|nr:plant cysteine oxidase 2-like [Prosopis cineraria]